VSGPYEDTAKTHVRGVFLPISLSQFCLVVDFLELLFPPAGGSVCPFLDPSPRSPIPHLLNTILLCTRRTYDWFLLSEILVGDCPAGAYFP